MARTAGPDPGRSVATSSRPTRGTGVRRGARARVALEASGFPCRPLRNLVGTLREIGGLPRPSRRPGTTVDRP